MLFDNYNRNLSLKILNKNQFRQLKLLKEEKSYVENGNKAVVICM